MGLPSPDELLLTEAVTFVIERCDCSKRDAQEALRRAGRAGRLHASGSIGLLAVRDPKKRADHPARRRETLKAVDWDSDIDWGAGTVGLYFLVVIERDSIEAWINHKQEAQSQGGLTRLTSAHKVPMEAVTPATEAAKPIENVSIEVKSDVTFPKRAFRETGDAEYKQYLQDFRAAKHRAPTRDEDEKWGRANEMSRLRIRKLREQLVGAKVGRPKKKSDS